MSLLLLPLFVYLAAVAETSLVDAMRVGDATPDLLALVAVVWLLVAGGPRAFLTAAAIALAGDLVAPGRLGVGMAAMLLVGYAVTWLRGRFGLKQLWCRVPMVFAAVMLWALGVGLVGRLLGDVSLVPTAIAVRALGVGLYTAGVSLPVLMVLGWIGEARGGRFTATDAA